MILQSLYELYDRLRNNDEYAIAPPGYSLQKISFRVVLKPNGGLHNIESLRDKETKRPRQMVMMGGDKPTGKVTEQSVHNKVQFLRNDLPFMVGISVDETKDDTSGKTTVLSVSTMEFEAFRKRHLALKPAIPDDSYKIFCRFLESWNPAMGLKHPEWADYADGQGVFQILGETGYIHERPAIRDWYDAQQKAYTSGSELVAQCLITGKKGPIARLHEPKIKRVAGAQPSGAPIVSFDKDSDAFASYGRDKEQSFNAPVSEDAAFRYATALNALLDGPMSYKHRFTLGDATVVFWTKEPTNTEDIFAQFASGRFIEPTKTEAQDETMRQKIELFMKALRKGREAYAELDHDTDHTPFFLLGLTGQAKGRIGVRFFHRDLLSGLLDNLRQHYADMGMVRQYDKEAKWPEFPTLWQILDETCPRHNGKTDRDQIPPILEGPLLHAVLKGAPYPASLFSAVMRRLHADREVNYVRACIIAGYLRRNLKKEVSMSLDVEKKEPAYRLGRLFAVLEKVQGEAIGKATIRGSFYSAASATPGVVFPRLLRTYQHHLANPKIEVGLKIGRERLVQEILAPLTSFPAHLNLAEQGFFALGYYHQAKDLWTSKEDKQNNKGE